MNRRSASTLALILTTLFTSVCFAQRVAEASKETSRAEVEQCVAQHDSARQLRLDEQWQGARTAMNSCADERCPLAIAADCRAWLDELARLMPTLIVVVEGQDLAARQAALRVELDGTSVELKDPPSPIELLPGKHRLRLELPGNPPVETEFSLEKGEKNHIERVRFAPPTASRSPAPAASRVPTRPVPAATYWLAGGALVAFASSTALLVSGLNEHDDARAICAPTCDPNIRTSIDTRLLLADVAGGAGLVLGGLAVYTYLRRPVVFKERRHSGPKLSANGQGISLIWRGEF
ncbi:MAG TPA: hypothetical protein VJV79_26210 [Polyangiaceae bacterium]|nr:hypothetical protein [Polyangiaceae bacterium]